MEKHITALDNIVAIANKGIHTNVSTPEWLVKIRNDIIAEINTINDRIDLLLKPDMFADGYK